MLQIKIKAKLIRNYNLGMLSSLDESVGRIIKSLDDNGMLENSIVLFISDNGAPSDDPIWGMDNSGSNWPLRGVCDYLLFNIHLHDLKI